MENEPSLWKKIKSDKDISVVETGGTDSIVYKVNEISAGVAAKHYRDLSIKVGVDLAKEILRNYYADTERAQKLLEKNPNPLRQSVEIESKEYPLCYIIVPQGGVMVEGDELHSSNDSAKGTSELKASPVVLSQSYIEGFNLQKLKYSNLSGYHQHPKDIVEQQKVFIDNDILNYELGKKFADLVFNYLNHELNVVFSDAPMNVKPFLKREEGRVEMVVTDLAGSLERYYYESNRLKTLRSTWYNRKQDGNE